MKYYNIKVNLTEYDLSLLESGEDFLWTFITEEDENVSIKINLFKGEEK